MVRKSKKSQMKTEIFQTDDKNVKCTKLPEFIRAKKYLGAPFCVYFENLLEYENVKCTITAGNFKNPNAELKNNESIVKNGVAEFNDLRFLGKSGRGTRFNVYIQLETCPPKIITYHNAIKVTVDGPRPPRMIKPKVQEAIKMSDDLACLRHKYETSLYIRHDPEHKQKLLSQPIKKRFIQTYFMEEELYSNGCSSNSSESSFLSTSPAISPNPSSQDNSKFFSTFERVDEENAFTSQDDYYKDLINKYLLLFTNMYKIKITDELTHYLVDLVLSKTKLNTTCLSLDLNNLNLNSILNDEQFLINFQLFYKNLVQNFGKTNIQENCSKF